MDDDEANDLNHDLDDFVQRYMAQVPLEQTRRETLQLLTWNEPGEAAGLLLCAHVVGRWTLSPEELEHLWLIGRTIGGYEPEQLIEDYTLTRAAPGRAWRPADPPGIDPPLRGGAHRPGRGFPGKREFPATWPNDHTVRSTMDVARRPSGAVELPGDVFRAYGDRDGVQLSVIVSLKGDVLTSYPVAGDGVVQNPRTDVQERSTQVLVQLLDTALPAIGQEPRASLDELLAVGEWPHVVTSLRAVADRLTAEQQAVLSRLARLCGLPEA